MSIKKQILNKMHEINELYIQLNNNTDIFLADRAALEQKIADKKRELAELNEKRKKEND